MVDLLQQCIEILQGQPHRLRQDGDISELEIQLPNSATSCRKIVVDCKRYLVIIYSTDKNAKVDGDDLKKLALRFITKANDLLSFGNIEMNYETGEFRFKTSQSLPGVADARAVIQYMLETQDLVLVNLIKGVEKLNARQDDAVELAEQFFRIFQF